MSRAWSHITTMQRWARRVILPEYWKEEACWEWRGGHTDEGYLGAFQIGGGVKSSPARYGYTRFVEPIPGRFSVDHLCRNRGCVNPMHLEAVPHGVNTLRGNACTAIHARKTHCPQGHPYDSVNTYLQVTASGIHRECRKCRNAWNRAWRKSHKEQHNASVYRRRAAAKARGRNVIS
jgi:hypothetical protein